MIVFMLSLNPHLSPFRYGISFILSNSSAVYGIGVGVTEATGAGADRGVGLGGGSATEGIGVGVGLGPFCLIASINLSFAPFSRSRFSISASNRKSTPRSLTPWIRI